MTEQMEGQVSLFDLDTWSGKTFLEHSVQTVEETFKQSSRKSSESQSRTLPMCLCLRKGGQTADASTMNWGGWSVAWRVHDAQFWGVPQRRKRIALVADFGGLSAPEVLFVRKGLQWDPNESGEAKQEASGKAGDCLETAISFQERSGKPGGGREY